jgi:aminomethyltransferase
VSLKRTPFYELHRKLGAKIVEFGGWEMPLQYTSILEEHRAVRQDVGIFDVSHMGQIEVSGEQALDLVQFLIPNDAGKLEVDQALYSPLCNERGGVIDDLLVYRLPDRYLLVVNAATTAKDVRWVQGQAERFRKVAVRAAGSEYAQIAVQGPRAEETLQRNVEVNLARLAYYHAVETEYAKEPVLISRTGYTGEDGFEVYGPPETVVQLWKEMMKSGVPPIGLGARDSLRFEASYPLYGHELDEETTPVEAGLGWTVKEKPMDYIGKDVLLKQKRGEGVHKRLAGFQMKEPGVPRQGYKLLRDGEEAGYVTSGMKALTLGDFLGMGYLRGSERPPVGMEIEVEIHGKLKRAEIVQMPFYRGSIKR